MKRGDTRPAICVECGATYDQSHHHQVACPPCRKVRINRNNAAHTARVRAAKKAGVYQTNQRITGEGVDRGTLQGWKKYCNANPIYFAGCFPGQTVEGAANMLKERGLL